MVSYRSILERGFALVSDPDTSQPIRSAAAAGDGKALDIEFHDGHVRAVSGGASAPAPSRPRRRKPAKDGSQGSLAVGNWRSILRRLPTALPFIL